jgi:hypothetical protein
VLLALSAAYSQTAPHEALIAAIYQGMAASAPTEPITKTLGARGGRRASLSSPVRPHP